MQETERSLRLTVAFAIKDKDEPPNQLSWRTSTFPDSSLAILCIVNSSSSRSKRTKQQQPGTRVLEIEAKIGEFAASLWGLTEVELREIQETLADLG